MKVKRRNVALFLAIVMCVLAIVTDYGTQMKVQANETTIVTNPTGKKGIIASYWTDEGSKYYDDPIALGVDHALFNIDINNLVSTDGTGEAYTYNGKTYYFKNVEGQSLYYTFLRMQQIRSYGITLTVQINMTWPTDSKMQEYIFPSGRQAGHSYYALNTSTEESREKIAAMLHYLVYKCPYVNNWIVGNEINSEDMCNYCGTTDVNANVTIAVQTYDLMYQAIQDINPAAKNYICLDNIWNYEHSKGIPAKKFLEEFAKREQDKVWHLAYHPYPVPYGATDDATTWNMWNKNSSDYGRIKHSEDTLFITGANLEQLTNFVKENYGSEHRIILTEFGFDSRAGEDAQAAALYYTYKAAERDPMIDACIYQPWTDIDWDFRKTGILDSNGNKRKIYNVFKYMDVDDGLANAEYYKNYLGINEWTDNIIYGDSGSTDIVGDTDDEELADFDVLYRTHIQNIGWQDYAKNGNLSGTSGRSLRLEGLEIKIQGNDSVGIQYTTHCQDYGWLPWSANGDLSGTEGESKRLEAIQIRLTGTDAALYDVYYRVHAQNMGWLGWAKNGESAGTAGYAYRLEAMQIVVKKKDTPEPAAIYKGVNGVNIKYPNAYYAKEGLSPVVNGPATSNTNPVISGNDTTNIVYRTHVQNVGWQGWKYNGAMSGTSGRSYRLEGIQIKLTNCPYTGGVQYRTHIQNIGWESAYRTNGQMSGTSGRSLRLEAIELKLYGEVENYFDIYYRVHAQNVGWMGWAKNGESAGTAGYSYRLEGIQIVLVPKGQPGPAQNYGGIVSRYAVPYISR